MRAVSFALRSFGRELRSGEVLVLLAAVALAVAALTAVGFLTDRIGKAVARQANEVLAADLRFRSQEPIPDSWREKAAVGPGAIVHSRPRCDQAFTTLPPEREGWSFGRGGAKLRKNARTVPGSADLKEQSCKTIAPLPA